MLYKSRQFNLLTKQVQVSGGLQISNIGSKIYYTGDSISDFLPQNLKLGTGIAVQLNDKAILMILVDANKLLVPTPPRYLRDETGQVVVNNGQYVISAGMDPDVGVLEGTIQSFYDAPGSHYGRAGDLIQTGVAKEEFREINWSFGAELRLDEIIFLRSGFFYEHYTKGNRQYATVGLGGKFRMYEANVSYLVPISQQHPWAKTLQVGVSVVL